MKLLLISALAAVTSLPLFAGEETNPGINNDQNGLSWNETSGWRFRRIQLDGSVTTAQKGQNKSESDENSEETYIDSLNRQLRHDASDIYTPLSGSEVALSAKRSVQGEIWNDQPGEKVANYLPLTRPFGLGWNSGLAAHLRFEVETVPADCPNVGTPDYVYVVDENGATYRFAAVYYSIPATMIGPDGTVVPDPNGSPEEGAGFLPLPSNRTDQDVLMMRLEFKNGQYVFTRKFGTKLYFNASSVAQSTINLDDQGSHKKTVKYHNIESLTDRLGNKLTYTHTSHPIIPSKITGVSGTGQSRSIQISQSNGQITTITDVSGRVYQYRYQNYSCDGQGGVALREVEKPNGNITRYQYEMVGPLTDTKPQAPGATKPPAKFCHLNLSSITSDIDSDNQITGVNGTPVPWGTNKHSTFSFTYTPDYTVLAYDGATETYYNPHPSRSRVISATNSSEGVSATFESIHQGAGGTRHENGPISLSKGATEASGDAAEFQVYGIRGVKVTDAEGHVRVFRYSDPHIINGKEIEEILYPDESAKRNPIFVIAWKTCTLNHPAVVPFGPVSEIAKFDINAGMADSHVTDYSGNVTTYEYADRYKISYSIPALSFLDGNPLFSPKYKDPTKETTALGTPSEITKRYKYYSSGSSDPAVNLSPASRIMTEMTDPLGRVTRYTVNSNTGLRTSETNLDENGNLLLKTVFSYGDPKFVNFKTKTEVLGGTALDGTQFQSLITQYVSDATYGYTAQEITDPTGLSITALSTYDIEGNLIESTDPNGNKTNFEYDSINRLVKTTYPDTGNGRKVTESGYSPRGLRLWSKDENGVVSLTEYDKLARVTKQIYDMDGNGVESAGDIVNSNVYNKLSSIVSSVDPRGFTTSHELDPLQRIIRTTDEEGNVESFTYGENSGGSAFNTSNFKPTQTVDRRGIISEVVYDDLYRPIVTKQQYKDGSKIFEVRQTPEGVTYETLSFTPGSMSSTFTEYDKASNVVKITDPSGKIIVTVYDGLNREISTVNALGRPEETTDLTVYGPTGLHYKNVDALGRIRIKEYDGAARVVKTIQPDAGDGTPTELFEFDANGNTIKMTNPLGKVWLYEYDARNRKIKETIPSVIDGSIAGFATTASPITITEFDGVGNVVKMTDPRGNSVTTEYDAAYRVVKGINADGTFKTTEYDLNGNPVKVVDENGNATVNGYNPRNKLIWSKTNPTIVPSTQPHADDIVIVNEYDQDLNLVLVADGEASKTWDSATLKYTVNAAAKGHVTKFEYDQLGRLIRKTYDLGTPAAKVYTTEYDELHKTASIDPKGQRTELSYDGQLRLKNVNYIGRPQDNMVYSYDLVGNVLSVTYPNETATRKIARNTYQTYDALDRPITETSAGKLHTYEYDKANNRTLTIYSGANGRRVECSYDDLNRLNIMLEYPTGSNTPRVTQYRYDLNGNIVYKRLGNATKVNMAFDSRNRITSISNKTVLDSLISIFASTYDQVGNVIQISETYGGASLQDRTIVNQYDNLYRLTSEKITSADNSFVESVYTYDDANNRLTKTENRSTGPQIGFNYVFGDPTSNSFNSNQLVSYTSGTRTVAFTYDLNGNRETKTVTVMGTTLDPDTYSYDYDNRLISLVYNTDPVTSKNGLYHYGYDHRTRRVIREELNNLSNKGNSLCSYSGGNSIQEFSAEFISARASDADGDGVSNQDEFSAETDPMSASNAANSAPRANLSYEVWAHQYIDSVATTQQSEQYANANTSISVEYIRGSDWGGGVGGILYTMRTDDEGQTFYPRYNYYNSRGDVVAKADNSATVTWQASYEAFGTRTQESGVDKDRQKANTKDEDPHGLLNEGMRFRDLEAGVFITRDPAGFVDGPNEYTYVVQNPWSKFDAEGLFWGWVKRKAAAVKRAVVKTVKKVAAKVATVAKAVVKAVKDPKVLRQIASAALDAIPVVGTIKGVVELATGYDFIGGEKVDRRLAAAGLAASLVPGGKAAVKAAALAKKAGKVAKAGLKKVDDIAGKALCKSKQAVGLKGSCFIAGTLIATAHAGDVAIEDITAGQQVVAFNIETQKFEEQAVVQTFEKDYHGVLVVLETSNGDKITTTTEHPFRVVGQSSEDTRENVHTEDEVKGIEDGNWLKAVDLKQGDQLVSENGTRVSITKLSYKAGHLKVYNFEVSERHNYIVGQEGVLVHNANCAGASQQVMDFMQSVKKSSKKRTSKGEQFGSYEFHLTDGTSYIGKGPKSRMDQSIADKIAKGPDGTKLKGKGKWEGAVDEDQAFKDEYFKMKKADAIKSPHYHNTKQSPGKRIAEKDGEI